MADPAWQSTLAKHACFGDRQYAEGALRSRRSVELLPHRTICAAISSLRAGMRHDYHAAVIAACHGHTCCRACTRQGLIIAVFPCCLPRRHVPAGEGPQQGAAAPVRAAARRAGRGELHGRGRRVGWLISALQTGCCVADTVRTDAWAARVSAAGRCSSVLLHYSGSALLWRQAGRRYHVEGLLLLQYWPTVNVISKASNLVFIADYVQQ